MLQKFIFSIVFCFFSNCLIFSQQNVDGEFIFKTHLFLEKRNVNNEKSNELKDEKLFDYFIQNIKLKFDTLNSSGFSQHFIFLSLRTKVDTSFEKGVFIVGEGSNNIESWQLYIPRSCLNYVLAINTTSGQSFRLKGFESLDFNSFVIASLNTSTIMFPKIKRKAYLSRHKIEGVDLKCLWKNFIKRRFLSIHDKCISGCEDVVHIQ